MATKTPGAVRKLTLAEYALLHVLDGNSAWWEIQEATGLPEARCKEIAALFQELLPSYIADGVEDESYGR